MEKLNLINNGNSEVTFLSNENTLILKLKGIITSQHFRTLRSNVIGMIRSLGVKKLVINTRESEYQEFDFSDRNREDFYREAANGGIKEFRIIYPNKDFINEIQEQWKEFFRSNKININVSAGLS